MTTGVEAKSVYRRIRQNKTYNQERLRVLFGIIYRDPDQALEKWERLVQNVGFDKTFKKQRKNASHLGKAQGISILGLYKSKSREKMVHANSEFHKMARVWYSSVIEEEQVNQLERANDTSAMAHKAEDNEQNAKLVQEAHNSIQRQLQAIRSNDTTEHEEVQQ